MMMRGISYDQNEECLPEDHMSLLISNEDMVSRQVPLEMRQIIYVFEIVQIIYSHQPAQYGMAESLWKRHYRKQGMEFRTEPSMGFALY